MASLQESGLRLNRRSALQVMAATAAVGGAVVSQTRTATAQTMSDIDALNLVLNMEYLLAQFTNVAVGQTVPASRLSGNGIAGTPVIPGRTATFTDTTLRLQIAEMAADSASHLISPRVVIGALVARQPLIDISAGTTAPFAVAMQRAGVVAAGAAFDPYASEENLLYCLFLLKNISVAAYRGLAPTISNRVVTQNFTGLLGSESIHMAIVRSYLYSRGATTPRLRENCDKIAAFQRTLNGGDLFQGLSPVTRSYAGGTANVTVSSVCPAQANGMIGGLTAGRILNQLYLTSSSASAGGFFPEGVNGTIRTSAAACPHTLQRI